jgi:hypothetical protein
LRSLPARIVGSHIEQGETFTRLSTKAHFLSDAELDRRIKAARDLMGDNLHIKADRKPAEPKQPIDYAKDLGAL